MNISKRISLLSCIVVAHAFLFSCGVNNSSQSAAPVKQRVSVSFNADSAYKYVSEQVAFGPRVPGSEAHARCLEYYIQTFKRFGLEAFVQEGVMTKWDGGQIDVKNVLVKVAPEKNNRLLLCAHWDCRPWADHDPDVLKRNNPIDGANDGASGVGVLIEIARQLSIAQPKLGVDIVLFDVEDMGTPDHIEVVEYRGDTWCLGSQLWAASEEAEKSNARWGILLDMVGAPGALFCREMYSQNVAKGVIDKVWNEAFALGYNAYFSNNDGGYIMDDHYYVNRTAGIPCIDIIQYDPTTETGFAPFWHTHDDTMENVDRATLRAVGETVLSVVMNER